MKTFQITVRCHNAEGLREALEDLAAEVSLSRDSVDETELGDEAPVGSATATIKRI